jgi:ubiquinone/menaquinone biosynthesis C-methylase UbiE
LADYDMERHWSGVAARVRDRSSGLFLAGDDAPYYQYKDALFRERFYPKIPVEGLSVLDVGCGPGVKLRGMTEQHARRVVGCDQATEMVNLAQRNAPDAEIVQTDGEKLPFADREFDVVTTTTVLQHNPDDRRTKLLGEICRVSAKDVLLFEDTTADMPPSTTTDAGAYHNYFGRPVGWYAGVCSCHGFEAIEIERLETFVSRTVLTRLLGHLDRGPRNEGDEFSRLHLAVEKRTLPITKRLDRLIRSPNDELTLMHFRRCS